MILHHVLRPRYRIYYSYTMCRFFCMYCTLYLHTITTAKIDVLTPPSTRPSPVTVNPSHQLGDGRRVRRSQGPS